MNITQDDINLVKQAIQHRFIQIQILNREFNRIGIINGYLTDNSISKDSSSNIRTTASLSMRVEETSINQVIDLNMTRYLKILLGVKNEQTNKISWYPQGVFIINSNGFSCNSTERNLSLSLSDLMYDFTSDRRGTLDAYAPLIQFNEKIQDVIIDMVEGGGITNYNIAPICPYREDIFNETYEELEKDYLIPYDITFETGVSRYDVIDKLRNLYPQWEMFCNSNGTFILQKELLEQDDSAVLIDDNDLRGLVISEDRNIDYKDLANEIIIYGKDGLCKGVARDENPESPFNVNAIGVIRKVYSGGNYDNIYTTYYDDEQTRVMYDGNDMAKDWAEKELYNSCRMYDSITLTLVPCPFINEVNFKISYRSKWDNQIRTYMVKRVSHSLDSTTLECVRFYANNLYTNKPTLQSPVITSYNVDNLDISITINPVYFATKYALYFNGFKISESTSTTITYTFAESKVGTYNLTVQAMADGYNNGVSDSITVTIENNVITTIDGDTITTIDNDSIEFI